MSGPREEATKEQRLLILRTLLDEPARQMNDGMIRTALGSYGHRLGTDRIRVLLAWLRDVGCIQVEDLDRIWVATLTPLGVEVVRAQTTMPGIAHPMDVR